ncbi:hypothetical protein HDU97_006278 [Phlyctochytrium planicorne]|nr:hypothetical protein HDU97_006278 [Phlyctochytrium planicorne]
MPSIATFLTLLCLAAQQVRSHGFFYSPNGEGETYTGSTRQYDNIVYNIDSLRSPSGYGPVCRGAPPSTSLIPVFFGASGTQHTVMLAMSLGAQHIGPCTIDIINPDTGASTQVAYSDGCARPGPSVSPYLDTDKNSPASNQCPGRLPDRLRTDDMCLFSWTFTLQNVEQITCTKCVMRWFWTSTHSFEPELYENCIDVYLYTPHNGNGGGDGGNNNKKPKKLDVNYKTGLKG